MSTTVIQHALEVQAHEAPAHRALTTLSPAQCRQVSGGVTAAGLAAASPAAALVIGSFAAGYAVGTAIDRMFIAPLWR